MAVEMKAQMAPVCLFAYNRPEHTRRTLASLASNRGAEDAELIAYADAPKKASDEASVEETRRVLREAKGFKRVELVERAENLGLARNIIGGVSEVMGQYGRAIILEDDLETAPSFLSYMNESLERYRDEKKVWHVSGHTAFFPQSSRGRSFLWRFMDCWGWATWADRWSHFRKDPAAALKALPPIRRYRFDMENTASSYAQISQNADGRIDTWAVFWFYTIFSNRGLCLNPELSLVLNIGLDGSGEHCSPHMKDSYDPGNEITAFPSTPKEDRRILRRIIAAEGRRNGESGPYRFYRFVRRTAGQFIKPLFRMESR
jgi:hypothetical protein